MHPFFSVTIFTGQQLVLEALQRWLTRPCTDAADVQRQRRGLKGLLSLLIKTTATGMLATVLDAAIEFRRRQLLAAAAAEPEVGGAAAAATGFPGLGMLSRAGIASWKTRLLLGIDELERRAHAYGIESRHRFSPTKEAGPAGCADGSGGKLAPGGSRGGSCPGLEEAERSQRLGRTVQQLRELVKQGDPESQRRADAEVGSLVDLLLGTAPRPAAPHAARSRSVPAALNRLAPREAGACMRVCRSRPALAAEGAEQELGATASAAELCHICMDRCVDVQVAGCLHELCFGCARRLCDTHDHALPQCPFCRQPIDGFVAADAPACEDGCPCGGTPTALACAPTCECLAQP